ncbi:MAG TPA: hypothetical protein VGP64_08085, partial [Polyangia bacterium]
AGCNADNQCAAGRCVDGVCCNSSAAACPQCQACNVTGSSGTCTFVGAGAAEPHGLCAPNGACGNTGACAADASCARTAQGTICATASCAGGTATSAAFCDGAGSCAAPTVQACDPYVCDISACRAACASDGDCIIGDYCDLNGTCQTKKTPGTSCASTDECASGVCAAEGVCCDTACDGPCASCTVSTAPGTCTMLQSCM